MVKYDVPLLLPQVISPPQPAAKYFPWPREPSFPGVPPGSAVAPLVMGHLNAAVIVSDKLYLSLGPGWEKRENTKYPASPQ